MTDKPVSRQELRERNKAHEAEAKRLRKRRPCRTCGRALIESLHYESRTRVVRDSEGTEGVAEEWLIRPAGTFGHSGSGICTLRCALAWARRHAPEEE